MEDVEDEPLYLDRACGLDVAKGKVDACIRMPSDNNPRRRAQEVRTFGTTKKELLALADWLRVHGVTDVAMEATGDYWKAPFFRLEAEGYDCVLADAKQVKHLPGRPKTDKADCVWLAKNFERGMLAACFVATEEFRTIRLHTRYRRNLTEERTREKQRVEKLLEDALIKLSCVLTDVHGVSGRAIMEALIAGQKDPRALADLAVRRARNKIRELVEALDGADTFKDHHAFLLRKMLDRIDRQSTDIDDVSAQIDALLAPYEEQLDQIDSVTGFGRRGAQDLLAEIGVDMTRFRTGAHLVSWSGYCPQVKQSAGKLIGRNARTKGNRYIGAVLGEASVAAGRTKTRVGARYRRLAKRRGKPKAQVATGNTQLKIIHHLLSNPGTCYEDLGPDYYETRMHHRRQVRNHIKSLERLGYTVTLDTVEESGPTGQSEEEVA